MRASAGGTHGAVVTVPLGPEGATLAFCPAAARVGGAGVAWVDALGGAPHARRPACDRCAPGLARGGGAGHRRAAERSAPRQRGDGSCATETHRRAGRRAAARPGGAGGRLHRGARSRGRRRRAGARDARRIACAARRDCGAGQPRPLDEHRARARRAARGGRDGARQRRGAARTAGDRRAGRRADAACGPGDAAEAIAARGGCAGGAGSLARHRARLARGPDAAARRAYALRAGGVAVLRPADRRVALRRAISCGVVREGARTVVVGAGVGTSVLPLRLGAPPDMWMVRVGPVPPGAGSPRRGKAAPSILG